MQILIGPIPVGLCCRELEANRLTDGTRGGIFSGGIHRSISPGGNRPDMANFNRVKAMRQ